MRWLLLACLFALVSAGRAPNSAPPLPEGVSAFNGRRNAWKPQLYVFLMYICYFAV